jgi:hypothetical protein
MTYPWRELENWDADTMIAEIYVACKRGNHPANHR